MGQTPRERARLKTMEEILVIGRRHLAVHGAAGLSLRAVARDLGVVSSAVYRYVKSRDELLTLLLVDGYNALGDAVDRAVGAAPEGDFPAQFRALGRAVRTWALAEPTRYGLLFGSPVPGYDAPAEQTTGPGTRVIARLVAILEGAYLAADHGAGAEPAGATAKRTGAPAGPLAADFQAIRAEWDITADDDALGRGILAWAAIFGAVSFEVFGQYGKSTFADPAALFEVQLEVLAGMAGVN
ncbi:TetR family transcriptional regulator [Bacillus sp. SRB_336]|nr:TetR family transcriptional regulator [Bacillus sp. SRB_336]